MTTDTLQAQYFRQQLQSGVEKIFADQRQIAASRIYAKPNSRAGVRRDGSFYEGRSGTLLEALSNPQYLISASGQNTTLTVRLPQYIRFIDMRRRQNAKIYNRPIWGTLYSETMQNIRFEYREWLRKHVGDMLQSSF